jgi:hypothetical protein
MTAAIITLESATQKLDLSPDIGGSVTAWEWKDGERQFPLFRPWDGKSDDRYTVACFPLVPWSKGNAVNILQLRIGNGGNTSELDDVNEDPKKSSLFSFTVESPWNCVKQR